MVKQVYAALLLAVFLVAAGAQTKRPTPKATPIAIPEIANRKLIVISIDGLDSRFLRDADRFHLKIPTLRKLAATGLSDADNVSAETRGRHRHRSSAGSERGTGQPEAG